MNLLQHSQTMQDLDMIYTGITLMAHTLHIEAFLAC